MFSLINFAARIQLKNRIVSMAFLAAVCIAMQILTLIAKGAVIQTTLLIAGPLAVIIAMILTVTFNIIADAASLRNVFTSPSGYLPMLAPVPGWKLLLSRVLPIVFFDSVCVILGYIGCVRLVLGYTGSFSMSELLASPDWLTPFKTLWALEFVQIILLAFLSCALAKSIFFRFRQRIALGIISFILIRYLLSLLDILLAPFAMHSGNAPLLVMHITTGFNAGMIAYVILSILKITGLFFITSFLIERKINL